MRQGAIVRFLVVISLVFCSGIGLGAALLPTIPAEGRVDAPALHAADLAFREQSLRPTGLDNNPSPLAISSVAKAPPKLDRMRIQSIGVDAPLNIAGKDEKGVMAVPPDDKTVAWYDFTSRPGTGGNAVFAGHLDYRGVGPAVFWNLRKLKFSDVIDISMSDGSILRYQVVSSKSYTLAAAPLNDIVGPTAFDAITLITCSGTFSQSQHLYSERLIVRAQRVW